MSAPHISSDDPDAIVVVGAREHNLKGVDLEIPRDSLVVFTGLSGSGKSSLAFDTIFQEGQRRFMESLSAYARQFLGNLDKPRVDHVAGLSPTISIDQKTVNRNPRSTVGTITEIFDHLRLMMARLGKPHCPICGATITALSAGQITDRVLSHTPDARVQLLAPIVRERKGEYRKELKQLLADGWLRARVDGELRSLEEDIPLARYEKHTIEVVVDRVKAVPESRERIFEAVERALAMAGGIITALIQVPARDGEGDGKGKTEKYVTWSSDRACSKHPEVAIPELEPRLFSFNTPQGACQSCNGLGALEGFDPSLLIDPSKRIPAAVLPFREDGTLPFSGVTAAALKTIAKGLGADLRKAWKDQPDAVKDGLLTGEGVSLKYTSKRKGGKSRKRVWSGLLTNLDHIYHYTRFKGFDPFRRSVPCPDCGGARLNAVARAVTFREQDISALSAMSVWRAHEFFKGVRLKGDERKIGQELLREVRDRLTFLDHVGLGYLALNRSAATLSGGEAQRIRLAAQVGSGLQGVTYVLDEPSIGLHPRDNRRLLDTLIRLRDQGNSVLVVEHDRETMEAADWLVDVGPGAGRFGGEISAQGTPARFIKQDSVTARYLRGVDVIPLPDVRRTGSGEFITIEGARANNLQSIDVRFPLGTFTVLTGVSGSGKSTLLMDVLWPVLHKSFFKKVSTRRPGPHKRVTGLEHLDKVVVIDQSPIGRTPRSNPATYAGAFTPVRELFSRLPESRARGYKPGRFSFNVVGGRCEECTGAGVKTIEMQFLADVEVVCDACGGKRFNEETLEIRYRGQTITDVLEMSIAEAHTFFTNHKKLKRILSTLETVGLGYVKLGQPSTTLSGGEAQRVKLATELQRPATGRTLYLLDEPTTGLHFQDVRALLGALDALVESGNTVVVIEHNTDVIKVADHLIELGPDGGEGGGLLVGEGTPEHVAGLDTPTGVVLAELPEFGGGAVSFKPRKRRKKKRSGNLEIRGATCHNLKSVDVTIPRNKLTVITGVSGSGKSSLAFDTIFAEGQRRYVESLSTYARRFLGRLGRAPVEKVEGLAPAIAINQKTASHNPRSTVATVTEVYDYLRLIWSRIGIPHCPKCRREVLGWAPSPGARRLKSMAPGRGWLVADLSPARGEGEAAALRLELMRDGYVRLLIKSRDTKSRNKGVDRYTELALESGDSEAALAAGTALVIDRLDPAKTEISRMAEALNNAYHRGNGRARFVSRVTVGEVAPVIPLSLLPTCTEHGRVVPDELNPRNFSFNSHHGACAHCEGLGKRLLFDVDKLLPDPSKPLSGAMDSRVGSVVNRSRRMKRWLGAVYKHLKLDEATPVKDWTPAQREGVLHGIADMKYTFRRRKPSKRGRIDYEETNDWVGLVGVLDRWTSPLSWLRNVQICPTCEGGRLKPVFQAVTVSDTSVMTVCRLTVEDALEWFRTLALNPTDQQIAEQAMAEVERRLAFLVDVGLGYLNLERDASTLSGGEAQRIRLASQLGSGLTGCIYVLDEPTVGLHPRDTRRLLDTLLGLRDLGNTVLVVEHDAETMSEADYLIDMGPAAGEDGGYVVAAGTPDVVRAHPKSLTADYLEGRKVIPVPEVRREAKGWMTLTGATINNLEGLSARLPTGALTVVTGVSGSGKSSLIMDALVPALRQEIGQDVPAPIEDLTLPKGFKKIVVVNQQPIGRTPRSTPATYTSVMDGLRALFASTMGAKTQGWKPGRFSYNAKSGRCPMCEGRGAIQVEMHFLSDVWVTCESCKGKRYNEQTLRVRWKGHTIADVLDMRVSEALELFLHHRKVGRHLQALEDVGLGYIRLGQPGSTLSGGEAQRVKLAAELAKRPAGTVFVLDEPSTGLHFQDVARLVDVFHKLVDKGGTIVVIEHHPDIIKNADWVIDMGPEGGVGGGTIVAEGIPEVIVEAGTYTGVALAKVL